MCLSPAAATVAAADGGAAAVAVAATVTAAAAAKPVPKLAEGKVEQPQLPADAGTTVVRASKDKKKINQKVQTIRCYQHACDSNQ